MKTALAKPYKLTAGDVAESLWLTNAGQDDMARRLKAMTGTPRELAMVRYALDAEQAGAKRSTRLKPIEAAMKRLSKSAATLPLVGESKPPNWDRARTILAGIKTCLRMSLAGQVLLGQELQTIKVELGFAGSGRRKEKPHDAFFKSLNRTWEQWCKAELGISPDGADRFIVCYEAAKARVKKLGGDKQLAGLLETHPAKLTEESHKILAGMVDKLVWGETQKSLLEELRLVKFQAALAGGETPKPQKTEAEAVQQLAFAFFSPVAEKVADLTKKLGSLRIKQDYSAFLHQLDVVSDDPKAITLSSLEAALEAALKGDIATTLAEVRAAKAAKLGTANAA